MKTILSLFFACAIGLICGCKDVGCNCGAGCQCGSECRCGELGKCSTSCVCRQGGKCTDPIVSPDSISDKDAKDGEVQLPKMIPWFRK